MKTCFVLLLITCSVLIYKQFFVSDQLQICNASPFELFYSVVAHSTYKPELPAVVYIVADKAQQYLGTSPLIKKAFLANFWVNGPQGALSTLKAGVCHEYKAGYKLHQNEYYVYATTGIKALNIDTPSRKTLNYAYNLPETPGVNLAWEGDIEQSCYANSNLCSRITPAPVKAFCLNKEGLNKEGLSKAGLAKTALSIKAKTKKNALDTTLDYTRFENSACLNRVKNGVIKAFDVIPVKFTIDGQVVKVFTAPSIGPLNLDKVVKIKTLHDRVNLHSYLIKSALNFHLSFLKNWADKELPFHFGATLDDFNGHLKPGVKLSNVIPSSIFGDIRKVKNGDVIEQINGRAVYSNIDVFGELINHGLHQQKGIEKPLSVFGRHANGAAFFYQDSYFFNTKYGQFSGIDKNDALTFGFLDALSLGNAAHSICIARQVPSRLANGLRWLSEALSAEKKSLGRSKNPDYDACHWRESQELAVAQQKHAKVYSNAAWLTIITPSAPRLLFSKAANTYIKGAIANRKVRGIVVSSSLEMVETGIYFANDKSPLQSNKQVADDFVRSLPYIAGLMISVGVLTR